MRREKTGRVISHDFATGPEESEESQDIGPTDHILHCHQRCPVLSVERVRVEAHNSFTNTLSGTDIIVGARSSPINLLLYSVFHIGNATNNVTWKTYQDLSRHPVVKWTIPISLGDSYKGYRVIGTSSGMFEHFRYGDEQPLTFASGQPFSDLYHAVIGAEVAAAARLHDRAGYCFEPRAGEKQSAAA